MILRAKALTSVLAQAQSSTTHNSKLDSIRSILYVKTNISIVTLEGKLVAFHGNSLTSIKKLSPIIVNCWNINKIYGKGEDIDPCSMLQIENNVL
jgi:hypothetical protein